MIFCWNIWFTGRLRQKKKKGKVPPKIACVTSLDSARMRARVRACLRACSPACLHVCAAVQRKYNVFCTPMHFYAHMHLYAHMHFYALLCTLFYFFISLRTVHYFADCLPSRAWYTSASPRVVDLDWVILGYSASRDQLLWEDRVQIEIDQQTKEFWC